MLQLKNKKIKSLFYILLFIMLNTITIGYQNSKSQPITEIKNIKVNGLSELNNFKTTQALNSILTKNIFFINKKNLIKILGQNNLIESVYIKKVYPDLLLVNIKKVNFLAITNQNNKKFIIASNGKQIPFSDVDLFNQKLPFVFGEFNYDYFLELKKIIDKSQFKFDEIKAFYFFHSNRWDIKTNDDLLIKLPHKNLSKALKIAHQIKKNKKFKNNKILDLRIANHIITTYE